MACDRTPSEVLLACVMEVEQVLGVSGEVVCFSPWCAHRCI